MIPSAPERIRKQVVMEVTDAPYPMKPVVPFIKATQDRVVLEIQRGCIRGCRFLSGRNDLSSYQRAPCGNV